MTTQNLLKCINNFCEQSCVININNGWGGSNCCGQLVCTIRGTFQYELPTNVGIYLDRTEIYETSCDRIYLVKKCDSFTGSGYEITIANAIGGSITIPGDSSEVYFKHTMSFENGCSLVIL